MKSSWETQVLNCHCVDMFLKLVQGLCPLMYELSDGVMYIGVLVVAFNCNHFLLQSLMLCQCCVVIHGMLFEMYGLF